jgi:tRNA 2-thiouridine synthesizing protein A
MLTDDELKNISANKVVDARGTACPGPLLEAKRAMAEVKVEEIMEVLSSDTGTKRDIPKWAKKMGHDYLGCLDEAGYFRMFLKRMK